MCLLKQVAVVIRSACLGLFVHLIDHSVSKTEIEWKLDIFDSNNTLLQSRGLVNIILPLVTTMENQGLSSNSQTRASSHS